VLHVDPLLATSKDPLKELLFNGCELTFRAIENGLPVTGLSVRPGAGAKVLDVLRPSRENRKGCAEFLTGFAEREVALPTEPVGLLDEQYLLKDRITLANLASRPPRRAEEE
jgi:hypothetical protein